MTVLSDPLSLIARPAAPSAAAPRALPPEVEFILSALEAGEYPGPQRRGAGRARYRVAASLKLFSDTPQAPPWTLYVRDVNAKGSGFVTRHRLPLGYGGILTIADPSGRTARIDCTLLRCREAAAGWFEGSMYFNRDQTAFDPEVLKRHSR
jgi:hypothetical protein